MTMLKKVTAHFKRYNPYSVYAAKSELKGEVGASYLTWMWWILDPVLFMLVYVFITGGVHHMGDADYHRPDRMELFQ